MVQFSDKQWDRVRQAYRKWWDGTLGRPILPMMLIGADPGRPAPKAPSPCFLNCGDFSIPAEDVIDRMDYDLSCLEYHGDSFPWVNMSYFGPGMMAAFLGAKVTPAPQTVWFHADPPVPISELHPVYDEGNPWLLRVKDLYRAGMKKWGGNVCMSMVDIGGVLDVIASFTTTDSLLYALYDEPEEVLRVVNEVAALWMRYSDELNEIIAGQQGFSHWAGIYSEKPSYMLQSDFCYMIGPDHFEQFVKPELADTASKLYQPFYHLDGVGELRHLDSLLTIDAIKGIQWVPGDGDPLYQDWSEVYRKISNAGKKIQAYYDLDFYMDEVLAAINRPDDLVKLPFYYGIDQKQMALEKLHKYM